MIKKSAILIMTVLCVLFCFAGCGKKAEPIVLPADKEIDSISIKRINGTQVLYEDLESIQQVMAVISNAKATNKESVQDFPRAEKYGTVNIKNNGGITTVFYYEEAGKYYVEQPYRGIYRLEDNPENLFADAK